MAKKDEKIEGVVMEENIVVVIDPISNIAIPVPELIDLHNRANHAIEIGYDGGSFMIPAFAKFENLNLKLLSAVPNLVTVIKK